MDAATRTGARIAARGWSYRYPARAAQALSGVTFEVAAGELVVLMGASGSGKSTLLAALAGTLPAGGSSGILEVGAVRVGLVQQEPEGNIVMERVGDDVAFPLENDAVAADLIWARVQESLSEVGLQVGLDRATTDLSGGQTQLLAVAAASVADPGLLLLDEPTANLDPAAAGDVLTAVEHVRARTGCTVVVVEHRVEPWLARADRVLLASGGSVVALRPGEVAAHLDAWPEVARRVWVDHAHLPGRAPTGPPGVVVLAATGVAVTGRLPATDLTARTGEVVALTGPPGSGKTTLLDCLAGLAAPTGGSVEVLHAGGAARADPWRWPSGHVAATFGVVFQNPEHQFVTGRVIDELHHGLVRSGVDPAEAERRATAMLQRLHLDGLSQADPFTLSGGEQRRLSVASALVLDPRILLLDEPTFGQDPATWAEMVDVIADHRDAGGAVVLATHDPDLVRVLRAREVRLGAAPERARAVGVEAPAGVTAFRADGRGTRLRRLDPLALLGAAVLASTAALLSTSPVLNVCLALGALATAVVGGLSRRRVGLLAAPAVLAAVSVAFSNALLGGAGLGSADAWRAAALPASRVLAVALPGLVAAVALDPTALADALVVRLRVPARAAYSVLAGLRLLPLLAGEWSTLGRASRARGLGGSGLRARARQFVSTAFRLLVGALRRGGRLAVALDVRGLRPGVPRTVARPLHWSAPDTLALLVGALTVAAAAATRI